MAVAYSNLGRTPGSPGARRGSVRAWQLVMMACGTISIPAALLLFTFPEPARRSLATEQAVSLHEAFASVRDRWTIFAPLFLANAATILLSVAYSSWVPALLGRTWKIPAGEIGLTFGLIALFLSTASQFIAGFLVDITHKRFGLAAVPSSARSSVQLFLSRRWQSRSVHRCR
jgi:hypothetical protein